MQADPVAVLEAMYELGGDEERWIRAFAERAHPLLDQGLGVMGWTYRLGPGGQEVGTGLMCGAPDEGQRARMMAIVDGWRSVPEVQAIALRGYARGPVGTLFHPSDLRDTGVRPYIDQFRTLMQCADVVRVSVTDPSGCGAALGALVPLGERPRIAHRATLARLATHLRCALRARQSAQPEDALMQPDGKLVHCEEAAEHRETRTALREAARTIDRARGRMRRRDPEGAVALWRGLVDGTWTLVDRHESDGRRYVVARRNTPAESGLPGLEPRERACLLFVAMGHSQKLVAYELGLSEASVSRLLKRAMAKLGLRSRAEVAQLLASLAAAAAARAST